MELILVSGRSGSGKSTALRQLEDEGFFAIDILPVSLLPELMRDREQRFAVNFRGVAVCIDARNTKVELDAVPEAIAALPADVHTRVLYLDADEDTLVRRFSETRRRHPLTESAASLREALNREQTLLGPLAAASPPPLTPEPLSPASVCAVLLSSLLFFLPKKANRTPTS